jgi:hypothetical protein
VIKGKGLSMGAKLDKNQLPPLPDTSPGIPSGNRYREQYGVVLVCPDEASQQAAFEGLKVLANCKLKVVVT